MKIHIVFLCPYNNTRIGGGDRKYGIYYKNLPEIYFEKYMVYITNERKYVQIEGSELVMTEDMIEDFCQKKDISYIYFGGARINHEIENKLLQKFIGLVNVNFTPLYTTHPKKINLIISMTDYWKLHWMYGDLSNSHVVYNPIDVELWQESQKKTIGKYKKCFIGKKFVLGRIARAEPSKWHWLILATLKKLDGEKNYQYGFLFAGMPWLYRKYINIFLSKKMQSSIMHIPEQREYEDIAEFYASIDIFWQTSWIGESFGNVIAEAACFGVPAITDYKAFYQDGKVNPLLYDAQIELVDHEETGIYASYPDTLIKFLNNSSQDVISILGKNAKMKAEQEYNIKFTALTLAKILYEYGRVNLGFEYDKNIEELIQIPSLETIDAYEGKYKEKIALGHAFDKIQSDKRLWYRVQERFWRMIEYIYLFIRKIIKNYFKKDIESI